MFVCVLNICKQIHLAFKFVLLSICEMTNHIRRAQGERFDNYLAKVIATQYEMIFHVHVIPKGIYKTGRHKTKEQQSKKMK